MTRRLLVALVALVAATSACGGKEADTLPGGTFAGSTAQDRPFTIDVGGDIKVNDRSARYVEQGVLEVADGGVRTTLRCDVLDDKREELRCTVTTTPPAGSPTTEVIDLMLL